MMCREARQIRSKLVKLEKLGSLTHTAESTRIDDLFDGRNMNIGREQIWKVQYSLCAQSLISSPFGIAITICSANDRIFKRMKPKQLQGGVATALYANLIINDHRCQRLWCRHLYWWCQGSNDSIIQYQCNKLICIQCMAPFFGGVLEQG